MVPTLHHSTCTMSTAIDTTVATTTTTTSDMDAVDMIIIETEEEAISAMNEDIRAHTSADTEFITFTDPATGNAILRAPKDAMCMSALIQSMVNESSEEEEEEEIVPIHGVSRHTLAHVARFCIHFQYVEEMIPLPEPLTSGDIYELATPKWFADFAVEMHRKKTPTSGSGVGDTLSYDCMLAANFLDILPLLKLIGGYLIARIHSSYNTPEQIKKRMGLPPDAELLPEKLLSEEELQRVKECHPWAFEFENEKKVDESKK